MISESHERSLDIQEKVNSNYLSLEESIENIEPLLTLLETGFYLIADAICYPTDGDKNFFWNTPNKLEKENYFELLDEEFVQNVRKMLEYEDQRTGD